MIMYTKEQTLNSLSWFLAFNRNLEAVVGDKEYEEILDELYDEAGEDAEPAQVFKAFEHLYGEQKAAYVFNLSSLSIPGNTDGGRCIKNSF